MLFMATINLPRVACKQFFSYVGMALPGLINFKQ